MKYEKKEVSGTTLRTDSGPKGKSIVLLRTRIRS